MIWTHYGRWSNDGTQVYNNDGRVIYRLPNGLHQSAVLKGAVYVVLSSFDDPAQNSSSGTVSQQA